MVFWIFVIISIFIPLTVFYNLIFPWPPVQLCFITLSLPGPLCNCVLLHYLYLAPCATVFYCIIFAWPPLQLCCIPPSLVGPLCNCVVYPYLCLAPCATVFPGNAPKRRNLLCSLQFNEWMMLKPRSFETELINICDLISGFRLNSSIFNQKQRICIN